MPQNLRRGQRIPMPRRALRSTRTGSALGIRLPETAHWGHCAVARGFRGQGLCAVAKGFRCQSICGADPLASESSGHGADPLAPVDRFREPDP